MFKQSILLLEEDLTDKLTGKLTAPKRPAVFWVSNLHSGELEQFTGTMDRTFLSLWIQDRASRRQSSPVKTIEELTKLKSKEVCNRADSNFCVLGIYSTDEQKADYLKLFESGIMKYKDDPVTFYTVDRSSLRTDIELPKILVLRSKRGKFSSAAAEGLFSKIDNILSGSPLDQSLPGELNNLYL